MIFGIKPADSGTALIKGKQQTLRSPHQASVLGIGFCPEDRKTDGIIAAASVRENIILALRPSAAGYDRFPAKNSKRLPNALSASLAFAHLQLNNRLNFSGGNQQKVLLSRWLLTRPQFLILDEPTRGIDVGAHAEIIRLIETLCADGLALLVISSPNWKSWWAMPIG